MKEASLKKQLLTLAMIMSVMMVVQPTYAATSQTFNITVTISSFSMKLMKSNGLMPYDGWDINVPPGSCLTMTAMDAIMVSLTGALDKDMGIYTHVETSGAWNSVMPNPGTPLNSNEFILLADNLMTPPVDDGNPLVMAQPKPITDDTDSPLCTIQQGTDKAWLVYSFHAAPDYNVYNETITIKVEAMPMPAPPPTTSNPTFWLSPESNYVNVLWNKATDISTPEEDIKYSIFYSEHDSTCLENMDQESPQTGSPCNVVIPNSQEVASGIWNPAVRGTNIQAMDASGSQLIVSVEGLTPSTMYYFTVIAENDDGSKFQYDIASTMTQQ